MKKFILLVIGVWVGLAVFNFGGMNAQFEWDRTHKWASLQQSRRDNIGSTVLLSCLFPPAETISTLILTNFLQHGWYLGEIEPEKETRHDH